MKHSLVIDYFSLVKRPSITSVKMRRLWLQVEVETQSQEYHRAKLCKHCIIMGFFLILNYNIVAQEISIFSKYVHIALLDHRKL